MLAVNRLDVRLALIVIDLQKRIVANSTVHPGAEIVRRARALADAFRSRGLPVVLGYNVVLATDAMTDTSAQAHTNSVTRIFPRLGETGTTREIIDLLKQIAQENKR